MTVVFDLSGEAVLSRDPLDIMRMMNVSPTEETLDRIENVQLNDLVVRAVGAELTGSGAFEVDNEDYETFPGMPARMVASICASAVPMA